MRKIILLWAFVVASFCSFAQFNTMQFSPATFVGDDEVTFTIDLSGTSLAGETDLYIWAFCNSGSTDGQYPSKDGITNTAWGNSPDIAKLTNIGGNKWSYTFTGTDLFLLTPGQLKYFQFLIKTKTGSKQTGDSPKFNFAPVEYVPSTYRIFPSRSDKDDAIRIFFYQNLATDLVEQRMKPLSATVTLYNDATVIGTAVTIPLTEIGDKLFSTSAFIPSIAWTIPADATKITYVINGTSFDTNGNQVNVSGSVQTKTFDILH